MTTEEEDCSLTGRNYFDPGYILLMDIIIWFIWAFPVAIVVRLSSPNLWKSPSSPSSPQLETTTATSTTARNSIMWFEILILPLVFIQIATSMAGLSTAGTNCPPGGNGEYIFAIHSLWACFVYIIDFIVWSMAAIPTLIQQQQQRTKTKKTTTTSTTKSSTKKNDGEGNHDEEEEDEDNEEEDEEDSERSSTMKKSFGEEREGPINRKHNSDEEKNDDDDVEEEGSTTMNNESKDIEDGTITKDNTISDLENDGIENRLWTLAGPLMVSQFGILFHGIIGCVCLAGFVSLYFQPKNNNNNGSNNTTTVADTIILCLILIVSLSMYCMPHLVWKTLCGPRPEKADDGNSGSGGMRMMRVGGGGAGYTLPDDETSSPPKPTPEQISILRYYILRLVLLDLGGLLSTAIHGSILVIVFTLDEIYQVYMLIMMKKRGIVWDVVQQQEDEKDDDDDISIIPPPGTVTTTEAVYADGSRQFNTTTVRGDGTIMTEQEYEMPLKDKEEEEEEDASEYRRSHWLA